MCIGAPRAATTWLHNRLAQHPDAFLPKMKEIHFFDEAPVGEFHAEERKKKYDMNSASHWRWYHLQFAKAGHRISGDFTPSYSILSRDRVQYIHEKCPKLKLIYIMRNPVERAWSGACRPLRHRSKRFLKQADVTEKIRKNALESAVLIRGDYKKVIETWEYCFDRNQILYLFHDDVSAAPREQLNKVCDFLGLAPDKLPDPRNDAQRFNASPHFELPDDLRQKLIEYYDVQVRFLEKKFGRDLSHWYNYGR